jgi:hypothetical protein
MVIARRASSSEDVRDPREGEGDGDEAAGEGSGDGLDRGPVGLCLLDPGDDPPDDGVLADGGGPHGHGAVGDEGARVHLAAGLCVHREGIVGLGGAVDGIAVVFVDRDDAAGPDAP